METNLLAQRGAHISLGSCRNRARGQIASPGHLPQAMLYWAGRGCGDGGQWDMGTAAREHRAGHSSVHAEHLEEAPAAGTQPQAHCNQ